MRQVWKKGTEPLVGMTSQEANFLGDIRGLRLDTYSFGEKNSLLGENLCLPKATGRSFGLAGDVSMVKDAEVTALSTDIGALPSLTLLSVAHCLFRQLLFSRSISPWLRKQKNKKHLGVRDEPRLHLHFCLTHFCPSH